MRLYESRGLVTPQRTHSGRRLFSAGDLERLHRIVVLKSVGLSLAAIGRALDRDPPDAATLLCGQLEQLGEDAARIEAVRKTVRYALARLGDGEAITVETLCDLIATGDAVMNRRPKDWQTVIERYFGSSGDMESEQPPAAMLGDPQNSDDFAKWRDLGDRIAAALPLDPGSEVAGAFVREWFALLQPFRHASTALQWDAAYAMYDDMDSWADDPDGPLYPGFSKDVWEFMKTATAAHLGAGMPPERQEHEE